MLRFKYQDRSSDIAIDTGLLRVELILFIRLLLHIRGKILSSGFETY